MKKEFLTKISELHVKEKRRKKERKIQELSDAVSKKNNDLSSALTEISSLRSVIGELNSKLVEHTWRNVHSSLEKDTKTLLIGSSIIKDMTESNLIKTDIACVPGGGIHEAAEIVSNQPAKKYDRMVLVTGGNDCNLRGKSKKKNPSEIVEDYKRLVQKSKEKANTISVSSICPRAGNEETKNTIDGVNAGLQVMCAEENVSFIDNTSSFYLKDDTINDAYYVSDGVHLTFKGTNKLART